MNATYIEVRAQVRYWEDATINGTEDTDGTHRYVTRTLETEVRVWRKD
jgi:hypothetical protein